MDFFNGYRSIGIIQKNVCQMCLAKILQHVQKAVQRSNLSDHYIRAFRVLRPLRAINKVPSKYVHKFLILVDQWFNLFSGPHKVYLLLREFLNLN